jgi:serine/threonine protein phosphatase PrpC
MIGLLFVILRIRSLFGVCDGHGGSYCSQYLATNFTALMSKHSSLFGFSNNDLDITPHQLKTLFLDVFAEADKILSELPRMKIEETIENFTCFDSSGSTAVLCLVTSQFAIVANVGDSRAVLAQRTDYLSPGEPLTSPFQNSGTPKIQDYSSPTQMVNLNNCGLDAIALSVDHKPSTPSEKLRAEAAGAM